MSSSMMMSPIPVPESINVCPPAPSSKRIESRNVRPIPIQIEQVDSTNELLLEATTPSTEQFNEQDIMDNLEIVFYERKNNLLYKLFVDGTWESVKLVSKDFA